MSVKKNLFSVISAVIIASPFSALAANTGLTIVNNSDVNGNAYVNHQPCEASATCTISPQSSVELSDDQLKTLCGSQQTDCDIVFGVDGIKAAIGGAKYRVGKEINYVYAGKWKEYTVRGISPHIVEIYKR